MTKLRNNKHRLLLLAGAFLISFSAVYVKLAHVGPDIVGFYRNFVGTLFFIPILLIRREPVITKRNKSLLAVAGFVLFVDFLFWHRSIHLVGPGMATLLGNFEVFFLGMLSYVIFKEKLTVKYYISIIIAIGGLYLLTGAHAIRINSSTGTGIIYGLITSVMYALYLIFLKKGQQKDPGTSQFSNLFIIYTSTSISFLILLLIQEKSFHIPDPVTLVSLIGAGLFSNGAGWLLIAIALPRVRIAIAGLLLLLQPVFSYVWDILFFNKKLENMEAAGAVIALVAIYIGTVKGRPGSH